MPHKLILLRHAQTVGKQAGQRDFDRKLTDEGEAQARKAGQHFVMNSVKPDTVICSGAERARHTATLICESAGIRNAVVRLYDELYEADREAWINHIRSLKAETRNALCVGHNPVLSWLVSHLSRKEIDLSPAGFVIYELQGSWKEFESNVQEVFIANHPV